MKINRVLSLTVFALYASALVTKQVPGNGNRLARREDDAGYDGDVEDNGVELERVAAGGVSKKRIPSGYEGDNEDNDELLAAA
ncbi:hypothetical protein FT663_01895 [Candidozyma haemuli var. vulneris]|nr:hypothetical protein FT662_02034 [[Candida] haemuloni var. vulneris]KAF3993391.1 hypothetical protein FT663_01895 [[Candida] haemuloni var. vulneris]